MEDLKERQDLELEDYKGKWINIYFCKDGRVIEDTDKIFDSEEAATEDALIMLILLHEESETGYIESIIFYWGPERIFPYDYPQIIPTPYKET